MTMDTLDNQNFNATISYPAVGEYTFRVYTNDTIGNINHSETVNFTIIQENIIVNGTVVDSTGNAINTTLTIIEESNGSSVYENTSENHENVIIPLNTTYTIWVEPLEIQTINSVTFVGVDFSDDNTTMTEIMQVDEVNNTENFTKVFAVKPTINDFSGAEINFTAQGNALYRCNIWNFTGEKCDGNWSLFLIDLEIGNSYIIYFSNESRGFGIINISKAEHLNSTRGFISDITEEVKTLDGIWSETIPSEDYVRAIFETNLTSDNDITIYPRIISGNPFIEVYEANQNTSIANFSLIVNSSYNKILLTSLSGSQDTFDLKVIGGSVEFDYIVDPTTSTVTYTFTDTTNNKAYNATKTSNWTAAEFFTAGNELPATGYTNIQTNNNQNATCRNAGNSDYCLFRFVFNLNQTASVINLLNITWRGAETTDDTTVRLAVYNWTANSWTRIGTVPAAPGTLTLNLSGVNKNNHIGSTNNNVTLSISTMGGLADGLPENVSTDWVKLDVTYTDNNPQWSSNTTNNTLAGGYTLHSVNWTDDLGLSGYIFSFDNGTGAQVNDSFVLFSGTQNWSNVSKWVNTTGDATIRWRVFANDSLGQVNSTSNFTYTTVAAPSDTCTYSGTGNWAVNCNDNCSISSNIIGDGSNITFGGAGNFFIMANITGFNDIFKDNQCIVIKANENMMSLA